MAAKVSAALSDDDRMCASVCELTDIVSRRLQG